MIKTFLLILLLAITLGVVAQKNNQKLVVYYSVFSLIAASLYFFNNAPDVALAEISVGSAFIPLIFLIAISKQRTFTVMVYEVVKQDYLAFLDVFCNEENLKLKIIDAESVQDDEAKSIFGVFRRQDIDVIVHYNPRKERYTMTCKKSNVMSARFKELSEDFKDIRVIQAIDVETLD